MAFTCPRCGMTSHHPEDERHGYCGACHDWTGDEKHLREERAMNKRRRKVDFTGKRNLGEIDLRRSVFAITTNHAWIEPHKLFEEQDMGLFAIEVLGFGKDGEDADATILLRPTVAGQIISALIAIAIQKDCVEEVISVVDEELRATLLGGAAMTIHRYNVREN